jgi:hypothetical protein
MQCDAQNAEHQALPTANRGCHYVVPFKFWSAAHNTRNSGAKGINIYRTYSKHSFFKFNILCQLHFSFHTCCNTFQNRQISHTECRASSNIKFVYEKHNYACRIIWGIVQAQLHTCTHNIMILHDQVCHMKPNYTLHTIP